MYNNSLICIGQDLQYHPASDGRRLFIHSSKGLFETTAFSPETLELILNAIKQPSSVAAAFKKLRANMDREYFLAVLPLLARMGAIQFSGSEVVPDKKTPFLIETSSFPEKILLVGDGVFANGLKAKLENLKISIEQISLSKLLPSGKQIKGKKFVICAVDRLTFSTAEKLYEIASNRDAFVLFMSSNHDNGVRIGPMIAPQLKGAFKASFLQNISIDANLMGEFKKVIHGNRISSEVISKTAKALVQSLSTPTYPLLWSCLEVSKSGITATFLNNKNLSNQESTSKHFDIRNFLNPKVLQRKNLKLIETKLKQGCLVSIREAFNEEFSNLMFQSLDTENNWKLHESIHNVFHFHHHNIYDLADFSAELLTARLIFSSSFTKKWMSQLTGKDCSEEIILSPSWYMPGDHSLPHSDNDGDRSVSFVWHLTKNWMPHWGGGLYWCGTGDTIKPEFNALHLFNVSNFSEHMVTKVAPNAQAKRLAVNGWWHANTTTPVKNKKPEKNKPESDLVLFYPPMGNVK